MSHLLKFSPCSKPKYDLRTSILRCDKGGYAIELRYSDLHDKDDRGQTLVILAEELPALIAQLQTMANVLPVS